MTIFSKIAAGEIPCYKIAENDRFLAFLDISPLTKGHTLVIPKAEIDYLFDLDDSLYTDLQLFAKKVAIAIKKSVDCKRVGVAVLGFEVPHAHIHLVPMNAEKELQFTNPRIQLTSEEMAEVASKIAAHYCD